MTFLGFYTRLEYTLSNISRLGGWPGEGSDWGGSTPVISVVYLITFTMLNEDR